MELRHGSDERHLSVINGTQAAEHTEPLRIKHQFRTESEKLAFARRQRLRVLFGIADDSTLSAA
jgi:hypothetical protein